MTTTMNRVLKIVHFLVLTYSGVVSTLLLLKDASHRSNINDLSLVVGDFRSYFFNMIKSLGLVIMFILGLCFFARDSFTFFFSLLSIINLAPIAIVNDRRHDFNRVHPDPDPDPYPVDQEEEEEFHDDHHEEETSHALANSFKNYLVDHLDSTINHELAHVLVGPSNDDEINVKVEKDKFIEQQEDKIKVNNNDIEDYDIQITFDSLHTDNIYDDDQFLTMVEHQVDVVDKVNYKDIIIHEDQSIMKKRWGDEIFDQHLHAAEDIGLIDASIYYDYDYDYNEVSIQANIDDTASNIIKEEVIIFDHLNVNIPEEETKSLDETWKDIELLLSSQSKQSPRESMMPQTPTTLTPRRIRKVAKLKSSSIIESRDMHEWKDKKKTLSFKEEVYLRQRGGMIRNDSEDAESLNKKFDDFIAKNKQEMLIQRQESHQRFLEKTGRGGGGGGGGCS